MFILQKKFNKDIFKFKIYPAYPESKKITKIIYELKENGFIDKYLHKFSFDNYKITKKGKNNLNTELGNEIYWLRQQYKQYIDTDKNVLQKVVNNVRIK